MMMRHLASNRILVSELSLWRRKWIIVLEGKKSAVACLLLGSFNGFPPFRKWKIPTYYTLRDSVETECLKRKFEVKRYYRENYQQFFDESKDLDGAICLGKFSLKQAREFKKAVPRIVFVDSNPDSSKYHAVTIDLEEATDKVIDYLMEMGHRNIGYIGGLEYLGHENEPFKDVRERTYIKRFKKDPELTFNEDNMYVP